MDQREPYRPRLHFAPRAGWMNDPNGLIRVDDAWHLFFQYEPGNGIEGPMQWGHASSADLVHWVEHPVALAPDGMGQCFSGSAIETAAGDVKLFYTAHGHRPDGRPLEVQCLVHADRALSRFERDSRNPVVDNPGLRDFRDPKVIWHAPTARWIMLVTHGQSIGIRSSTDLIAWRLESTFGEGQGHHGGPWECPDLVEVAAEDGTSRWVLFVGAFGGNAGGPGTQYFVGDFDGHAFTNENPADRVLWVDHGRDYYAMQTFFGVGGPVSMAWAGNWQYARKTPTRAFRGLMAMPRTLSLVPTPTGLRLRQEPIGAVAAAFETIEIGATPSSGTYRLVVGPEVEGNRPFGIALFGAARPHLMFLPGANGGLRVRTIRGEVPGLPHFAHDYTVEGPSDPPREIEIFVDHGLVEVNAGGTLWLTNLHYPADVAGAARRIWT
jgi:fructan beta-fructosidase